MPKIKTTWGLCFLLLLLINPSFSLGDEPVSASPTQEKVTTWDENATAESLGLDPLVLPDDFYPLYVWDQSWLENFISVEDALPSMVDCELTMSHFVKPEDVPLCEQHGLKCLVEVGVNLEALKTQTPEEVEASFADVIASTKDSPSVIGYYLIDEPGAYHFESLGKAVAAFKKLAPGKFAYINLFPGYASTIGADANSQLGTYSFTEYLERFVQEVKPQCLSYDNYMVEYSEDMTDKARAAIYYNDLLEVRRVAQKYHLPFWNIISSLRIRGESSPPTATRMAFQSYTTLAAGGRGLGWFLYTSGASSPIDPKGNKTLTWEYMRAVNKQTRTLGVILNQYNSTGVYFTDPVPTPDLPVLPGKILQNVKMSFSPQGIVEDQPGLMVGEFEAKDGSSSAVMLVNLNFQHSLNVSLQLTDPGKTIEEVSPITGQVIEDHGRIIAPATDAPLENSFWILPGHGTLFLIK